MYLNAGNKTKKRINLINLWKIGFIFAIALDEYLAKVKQLC